MPHRIQYPGAVYHVMARGNRGREEGLGQLPEEEAEKVVVAWWVRRRTTVRQRWVSSSTDPSTHP